MSSDNEQVEIASRGTSYTVVGGGDNGPWWVKYSMQAGFMFILILVLWGAYDLFKTKLPTLVEPVTKLAETTTTIEAHTKASTEAQQKQAAALEKVAEAQKVSAEAQKLQANAIERWVNQQGFRVSNGTPRFYGPPEATEQP